MYLAKTYNPVAGFEGEITEWSIEFGDDAWPVPETVYCEDAHMSDSCYLGGTEPTDCVVLYEECDF